MIVRKLIFTLVILCFAAMVADQPKAQLPSNPIPVSDLGTREQGRTYPLKLTAKNVDCDSAQNFEFEIDSTPWLLTPNGTSVPGLGPGQSRSIPAQLDFTYMPPGVYYGHITARCTSCGWFIFAACVENGQDVILKVKVADPADPSNGANLPETRNPYASLRPYIPSSVVLNPQLSEQDVNVLNRQQRDKLRAARAAVKAAEKRGERARENLRNAGINKSDCERELARLKAALADARRKLAIAEQDAINTEAAAKQAAKRLKNFDQDNSKAKRKRDRTEREAKVMVKYISDFCKGGSQSRKCKNFTRQVGEYQKRADDAKKEHDDVNASREARKRAAAKAKADAAAEQAKVQSAKAGVNAAKRAYDAKLRECGLLGAALGKAQAAMEQAKVDAEDAVKDANKEEAKAAKFAADEIEDLIKKKKKYCEAKRKEMAAEVARLKYALEVGQKLKIFDDDGGKRANTLKEVNDKIWDAAQDLAQDSTIVKVDAKGNLSLPNGGLLGAVNIDSAEGVTNSALSAMKLLMDGLSEKLGSGGVPDVGQDQMLGGLKALALAVQSQVNAIRNPNTLGAMRNEAPELRRNAESFQAQEMKKMGIGKNAAERAKIQETINKIYRSPNMISNLIRRSGEQAARCAKEIKDLQERQKNLKKK